MGKKSKNILFNIKQSHDNKPSKTLHSPRTFFKSKRSIPPGYLKYMTATGSQYPASEGLNDLNQQLNIALGKAKVIIERGSYADYNKISALVHNGSLSQLNSLFY